MKITLLGSGTSQGVPIIGCNCLVCSSNNPKDKRLRSSILIQHDGTTIVIDTGPDFRQQMLRANVKELDGVVYTHEHKDHIAGMDDIRAYNFTQCKRMEIYATERVQDALKREFHYIFSDEKYPGIPEINLNTIDHTSFNVGNMSIMPIEVMHFRLPVLGFRVGDFTYITDANYISEKEKKKINGSRVIVIDALRREPHLSHFTLAQSIELMNEFKPERAYFTHISHQLGLHDRVEEELPDFIRLAFDGLEIEL